MTFPKGGSQTSKGKAKSLIKESQGELLQSWSSKPNGLGGCISCIRLKVYLLSCFVCVYVFLSFVCLFGWLGFWFFGIGFLCKTVLDVLVLTL